MPGTVASEAAGGRGSLRGEQEALVVFDATIEHARATAALGAPRKSPVSSSKIHSSVTLRPRPRPRPTPGPRLRTAISG